jgi:carboxyl-terminal processing protease
MKKTLFSTTISVLLLLIGTNSVFAFYLDVPEEHQYYNSIKNLYDLDLLPTEESEFNPDEKIKIPEFYELLLYFGQVEVEKDVKLPYEDTNDEAGYAGYIQKALDLEIIKKTQFNQNIGVEKTITKHQVLKTMFETLGIGTNYFFDKEQFPYSDLDKSSKIAPVAQKAAELGILENPQNLFKMSKRVTKGEVADYLYKIYQYSKGEQIETKITINSNTIDYSPAEKQLLDSEEFDIMLNVWTELNQNYLYKYDLNKSELIYSAIKGMINDNTDIYTEFETPDEAAIFMDIINNEYEGVGMALELIEKDITIMAPFKDSPAEKAGLKAKDIIIEIDGENIEGQNLPYVVAKIKGPANSTVEITVLRNGIKKVTTVTRGQILNKSVNYQLMKSGTKKIAYIEMLNFGGTTFYEFEDAAYQVLDDKVDGIILDLRNNPGGLMNTAAAIASAFSDKIEPALYMEYANGERLAYYANGSGMIKGIKTVIIINEGSASAAEILAATLKDFGVATIVGQQSYGKGVAQNVKEFQNGAIFKYTNFKWLTPGLKNINEIGITPDIIVENTETEDIQLKTALRQF